MKTLKTVVLTVFAIGFLTGVSQLKEETISNESNNQEINQPKVRLLTLGGGITKKKTPTML